MNQVDFPRLPLSLPLCDNHSPKSALESVFCILRSVISNLQSPISAFLEESANDRPRRDIYALAARTNPE